VGSRELGKRNADLADGFMINRVEIGGFKIKITRFLLYLDVSPHYRKVWRRKMIRG
jgi:hypothetical protein